MRKLLAITLICGAMTTLCMGQARLLFPSLHAPGSAYTGPGDVITGSIAWFSCQRGYNKAYATGSNPGCNIRRSSDNDTCDTLISATGTMGMTANCSNPADNYQNVTSFCSGTSCWVTTAYDQSGALACNNGPCSVGNDAAANQPMLQFNCIPFLATTTLATCIANTISTQTLVGLTLTTTYQLPISVSDVAGIQAPFSAASGFPIGDFDSSSGPSVQYNGTGNNLNMLNGVQATFPIESGVTQAYAFTALFATATTASLAMMGAGAAKQNPILNASSVSSRFLEATETTGVGILTSGSGNIGLFRGGNTNSSGTTMSVAEAGFWPSSFSAANRTSLCDNQIYYYVVQFNSVLSGHCRIDGIAFGQTTNTYTLGTSAHLTTTRANDVILVLVNTENNTATPTTVSTISGSGGFSGLAWANYTRTIATLSPARAYKPNTEVWYATPTVNATLSGDLTVTFATTQATPQNSTLMAFGVLGANQASPFDTNASWPAVSTGNTDLPRLTGLNTDSLTPIIIGVLGSNPPSGVSTTVVTGGFVAIGGVNEAAGSNESQMYAAIQLPNAPLQNATLSPWQSGTLGYTFLGLALKP